MVDDTKTPNVNESDEPTEVFTPSFLTSHEEKELQNETEDRPLDPHGSAADTLNNSSSDFDISTLIGNIELGEPQETKLNRPEVEQKANDNTTQTQSSSQSTTQTQSSSQSSSSSYGQYQPSSSPYGQSPYTQPTRPTPPPRPPNLTTPIEGNVIFSPQELTNIRQNFRNMLHDITAFSNRTDKAMITSKPESFTPWDNSLKNLFLSVGLDSLNKINKWDNLFKTESSLKILSNKTRQGLSYQQLAIKIAKDEYIPISNQLSQIKLFVIYRTFLDVYTQLERKLFVALTLTIGPELEHLKEEYKNSNDTLSLYCRITNWHIRSNAVTLQERINILSHSEDFVLLDPITDPGVLSEKLLKETKLINRLGGTVESITEKMLCIMLRRGINHTVEGRSVYKSTFEKIDEKGESYIFSKIKSRIDVEYRDHVLPGLLQKRTGKAYHTNVNNVPTNLIEEKEPINESANAADNTISNKKTNDGINYGLCFDFVRTGKCERGSSCKYKHSEEIKSMVAHSMDTSNWNNNSYYDDYYKYDHGPSYFFDDYEQSHYTNNSNWQPTRGKGKGRKGKGKYSNTSRPRFPFRQHKGKGKGKRLNQRFPNSTWENIAVPSGTPAITAADARVMELNNERSNENETANSAYDNYDYNQYQNDYNNSNEYPYDDDYY
jgi:hypothetical protein